MSYFQMRRLSRFEKLYRTLGEINNIEVGRMCLWYGDEQVLDDETPEMVS